MERREPEHTRMGAHVCVCVYGGWTESNQKQNKLQQQQKQQHKSDTKRFYCNCSRRATK